MTFSEPRKNIWDVIVIMQILIIVFIGLLFWSNIEDEQSYTIHLEELNVNVVHLGNFGANIISLSDKDFKMFPKLAPVIRDNTQTYGIDENGNRLYTIKITDNERSELIHQFGYDEIFFEYNGSYYSFTPPPLH
jgi:hypothetical protein